MRIIEFAVNNFRAINGGLNNNIINFNNSNTIFVFGQNNVGKSTFLRAYEFLYKNQTPIIDDFYKMDSSDKMEFELLLEVDKEDLEYIEDKHEKKVDSFKKYLNKKNEIRIRRTFSYNVVGKTIEVSKPDDRTWLDTDNDWKETSFGSLGLTSVFQALMPTPIFIKAMPTEEEVENVVNEILSAKAALKLKKKDLQELQTAKDLIKKLQEKMYNPKAIKKYKDEVNDHFKKLFPFTQIEINETDKVLWTENKFGKKFSVEFNSIDSTGIVDDKTPSSYKSIGHGAVRTAIFSLLLMRDIAEELERTDNRKEYLILFEEPELFLYPKVLKKLRELIYEVSEKEYPYQVLCASHSPQMIDISKRNSTLVRMTSTISGTSLFQINDEDLKDAGEQKTTEELKQKMYEILRFNPHICESFYADEVLLIEGPTEEIIIRGILQKEEHEKDLFIINCGTVNNIPFFQRVYRRFNIKTHIICDTDKAVKSPNDAFNNPVFTTNIQGTIYKEHLNNCKNNPRLGGLLKVHEKTFEPAHQDKSIDANLRLPDYNAEDGKPFNANKYWKEIIEPNYLDTKINQLPIVKYIKEILAFDF